MASGAAYNNDTDGWRGGKMENASEMQGLAGHLQETGSDTDAQVVEAGAAEMLRKIGWTAIDRKQVELYALMSPARKIEQMFRIRRGAIRLLRARLQREHPELSTLEIKRMVVECLFTAAEEPPRG